MAGAAGHPCPPSGTGGRGVGPWAQWLALDTGTGSTVVPTGTGGYWWAHRGTMTGGYADTSAEAWAAVDAAEGAP